MLGQGAYSFPEAGRLAGVKTYTARRWFLGRTDNLGSTSVLFPDYPPVDQKFAVSFLDLIDLHVVGRFRREGISLQTVRKVYARLKERFGSKHPFCHHGLLTDGRHIFLEGLDDLDAPDLEEIISGQKAFHEILLPHLKRIEYNPMTGLARRWNVADGVVVDPARCYGKPVLVNCNTTTHVVAEAFQANGQDVDLVADLFATTPEDVLNAVRFERNLRGNAAA
jgi:uncharacterized protein (DUF433 family)